MSAMNTNPASSDNKNRQASQVKAAAHQQAFATGRGGRQPVERERPQKKLTPQERAQQEAAEARKKLQQAEIESGRVRAELKKLHEQMEAVQAAHAQEIQRASERETGLWNDLSEIRNQASLAAQKASAYKKGLIGVLLLMALPALGWAAYRYGHPTPVQAASPAPHRPTVSTHSEAPFATLEVVPVETESSDFTEGAGRLNRALEHFRNETAETVLRRIHEENAAHGVSVCAFEWHKGAVSLIFGNQPGMEIGVTMARCAEAVERAAR
jgi:hypothetical protein